MITNTHADRHLRALQLAQACVELGARIRTIGHLTRLPHRQLQRLFFTDPQAIPRGRPPDSPEWYHSANVLYRAAASVFGVRYQRLRQGQFPPVEALISSYRHYLGLCDAEPRISFDRAFDLASHLDGIWIAQSKSFSVAVCPKCNSEHLTAVGGSHIQSNGCPFCKIIQRFRADPRVQMSFPIPPLTDPAQIILGIDLLMDVHREGDGDIPSETQD
jgi:flagellar transcriptional activator FlhC